MQVIEKNTLIQKRTKTNKDEEKYTCNNQEIYNTRSSELRTRAVNILKILGTLIIIVYLFLKYDILIAIRRKFQNALYCCLHAIPPTPWQNVILDSNSTCKTYGFFVTSSENNRSNMYILPGGRSQQHMQGLCVQHGHPPSGVGEGTMGRCWGHHKQARPALRRRARNANSVYLSTCFIRQRTDFGEIWCSKSIIT